MSSNEPETLEVDDLRYTIVRSSQRKTLGLTVDRDGTLQITAPADCPSSQIEAFERKKRMWVLTKLAEAETKSKPQTVREFVSGESFYYLGRAYRLKVIDADEASVPRLRLLDGRFHLRRDAVDNAERHFREWYAAHGEPWITERVDRLASRIGVTAKGVKIRDLGNRWGSCSVERGILNFHWKVITLPADIVEYVIVHEMVHLIQPRHNADFWARVERVVPDYEQRKSWLAAEGGRYVW